MAAGRSAQAALAGKLMWVGIGVIALLVLGGFIFSAVAVLFKALTYVGLLILLVGGGALLIRSFFK